MKTPAPFHVLIIEDSPDDCADLRQMLLRGSSRHYTFTETETGAAGIRAVLDHRDTPPDCVLLDYNLPDMDALDVLAALHAGGELTVCPVVVVTGLLDRGALSLRAGAQEFLGKSWATPESVTRAIDSAVERHIASRGRLATEAALRLANERFNLAVKCSGAVLFQQDLELRFTWLHNPAPGIDGSNAVGKREADLLERVEDVAVIEGLKREVIRSGVSMRTEFSPKILGVGHCFEVLMEPLRDAAGHITGLTGAAIDITERKRAEAARRETERNYQALADASLEVPYRMSADWSRMLPLDGRAVFASSDRPLADWAWVDHYLPSDEQPRVRQAINEAIAREALFDLEHRVRRLDGTIGWVRSRAVPILDENGAVIEWFGAASDITDRKQAEERLRLAIAGSNLGTWHWDIRTGVLDWSERSLEIFGIPPGTAMSYEKFLGALHPEDRARADEAVRHALQDRSEYRIEFRSVWPDGSVHWAVSLGRAYYDDAGAPTRMEGISLDITERKQAEESQRLLASIVEYSRDFIGISDTHGIPIYGNRAAMDLVGIKDLEQVRRSKIIDYFIPEQRPFVEEVVLPAVFKDGRWAGELTMQHFVTGAKIPVWYDLFRVDDPVTGQPVNFATLTRDLTESKRAEEALAEKVHFLQRIAEVTPGVLHVYDLAEKRAVFLNRSITTALGYSPEEVVAMGAEATPSLMHAEDFPRFGEYMARVCALADGEVAPFEFRMRDRAGAWHWFLAHSSVFSRDATGAARQTIGVASEITARKHAEAALAERTALLNGVLESTTDVIYVKDLNGRLMLANPAFAAAARSDPDQLVGKTDEHWFPPEVAAAVRRQDEAVIAGGAPRQFEDTLPVAGEARVFLTLKAPLRDGSGRVVGILGISRDITERKMAEETRFETERSYRALAAASSEIAYRMSADWSTMLPLDGRQLVASSNQPLADWAWLEQNIPPDEHPRVRQAINEAIARKTFFELEHRVRRPDGSIGWTFSRAVPILDENGEIIIWFGAAADITERKQAEEQVRLLNRNLEQRVADRVGELATKARLLAERNTEVELARVTLEEKAVELARASGYKSEFLANMSHELRTPLNVILLLSQQLAENKAGNLSAKQREFAHLVHSSGTDLLNLINDILDLAKIESGTVTVKVEEVSLARLCDSLTRHFQPVADAKKLTLHATLTPGLPPSLRSDTPRVRQILKNLVANALKFTARGHVEVRVGLATQGWPPDHPVLGHAPQVIAFAVEDTGIGIAAHQQRRIFESFRQADATTSRHHGGTGLGLAISRQLAALLGGAITLTSAPGRGSTFTLYLPQKFVGPDRTGKAGEAGDRKIIVEILPRSEPWVDGPDYARQGSARPFPEEASAGKAQTEVPREILRVRKVLVVDDDVRNVFALTALLENHEFETLSATDGRSAIRLLETTPDVGLVLMDIMMPDMDGYEIMRQLRQSPQFRTLPILALTAHAMPGDREKCLEAGASDYLTKPVNSHELIAVMTDWMDR